MSAMNFHLIYSGSALDSGEFDAQNLAVSILSVNDLLNEANLILNQNRAQVFIKVKSSFKTGSFRIDFRISQSIKDTLFASNITDAIAIIQALGLLVKLYKWLKGQKPTEIMQTEDGSFKVYKNDKYMKIEKEVMELYANFKIKQSFYKCIDPVQNVEGIESFAILTQNEKEPIINIEKKETTFFQTIKEEDIINEQDRIENLSIIKLSFKEGNKWQVSDGNSFFNVSILDTDYLGKINQGIISFNKDDIIQARIREKQYKEEGRLKKDITIVEILKHIKNDHKQNITA